MQPAGNAFGQQIVPDPSGAVGPIAANEARPNLGTELLIAAAAPTARSCQPGIEATPRDTERPAQPICLGEPKIKPLLPSFVRTCRDLAHFWSHIKGQSGHWVSRQAFVRNA